MKKLFFPLLLTLAMTITGCDLLQPASTPDSPAAENSTADSEVTSGEMTTCTVGNISFQADTSWTLVEGYEGSFRTADNKAVYMLQGESILGSYTPEEFYQNLVDGYKDKGYDIRRSDASLTALTLSDGAEAFVGRIEMVENKVYFSIDVLLIPQKNTALTFAAQTAENSEPPMDIREVSSTATVNAGTMDYISGNTFIADDNSEIFLKSDGSFIYHEAAGDPDSAYTSGTYEVYYGQAAIDKAVAMEEYGLTEEELELIISANMNGYVLNDSRLLSGITESETETYRICKDTFYVIILHNTYLKDSEGEQELDVNTMYIGHYLPELNYADLVNANSANYVGWTLEGVTE